MVDIPYVGSGVGDARRAQPVMVVDPSGTPVSGGVRSPLRQTLTFNANGQRQLVDVSGYASAMVHVQGTAVLSLKFSGTVDDDGVGPGGRRLYKTGVGSLGFSDPSINGTVDSEYRLILGGKYLTIETTAYTSGSVTITIQADDASPLVFVHGPVHDAEEEALRAGRLFVASSGFQSVSNGNYLNVVFSNPTGSGKRAFIQARRFGSTANSSYGGIANPTAATFTSPTSVSPTNAKTGGATSVMSFRWNMSATRIDSSPTTASPSGGLIVGYDDETLMFKRTVEPGQAFGNFIGGAGGGLSAAATCTITYYWYEEDLI